MIFRAFDELLFTLPAVFWSRSSPADAAKLLAQDSKQAETAGDRIVGRVDGSKVVLRRHRTFARNPLAPIFVGSLREAKDGTQLVGEFRRRKIVLLVAGLSYFVLIPSIPFALGAVPLMALWLGVSVRGAVLSGALFALVLLAVLFAEAVVIRLGIYAGKLDSKLIEAHVNRIFGRGATSKR